MNLFSKLNVSRENDGPRKFTFELTMSGIVAICVVALLGVIWIFAAGVYVGRDHKPEDVVPELAQIMPTAETDKPQEPAAEPTALKAEDLHFMEDLQGKPKESDMIIVESTQSSPTPSNPGAPTAQPTKLETYDLEKTAPRPAPTAPAAPAKTEKTKPAPAAAPAAKPQAEKTPPKAEPVKVEPSKKEAPAEAKASGQRYAATYQVASFGKREQAETMMASLSKKGFAPSLREAEVNGKKVYRVVVTIQGTEEEIGEQVRKTGEKGPMQLGKKPL